MATFRYYVNFDFTADGTDYTGGTVIALDESVADRLMHRVRDPLTIVGHAAEDPTQIEAIIRSGAATVAANVLPPGLRADRPFTAEAAHVRLGTAPVGADLIVAFNRNGTAFATVTVAAGGTTGTTSGLAEAFAEGDVLTWDITQVGATTAGSDVAAALAGTGT